MAKGPCFKLCACVCVDGGGGGFGGVGRYRLIIPFLVSLVVIIP